MSKQDHEDLKDVRYKSKEYGGEWHGNAIPDHELEQPKKKVRLPNPKDQIGAKKADMSVIPAVSLLHLSMAMMDGAYKYDPYNWRAAPVEARSYIAAAKRHLDTWLEGEEYSQDTQLETTEGLVGVHHLGHAMACCAILLDAMAENKLIDNRPLSSGGYHDIARRANAWAKSRSDKETQKKTTINDPYIQDKG